MLSMPHLRIDVNTVLVEVMSTKDILESYAEIRDVRQINDDAFFISLFEKQFLLLLPSAQDPASEMEVWLYNDEFLDYPHVMLRECRIEKEQPYPKGTYRAVCLYEQESVVHSLIPYEEKITDCIDRLIEILSMNKFQREQEFHKEFMFYWNNQSEKKTRYHVYLQQDTAFTELDVYFGNNSIRLIDHCLALSDLANREKGERVWTHHFENEAFYIPITDLREILPPHRGYKWTDKDLINIIYGKQINHIDDDSFEKLKTLIPKSQNIILVFGMKISQTMVAFAMKVKCRNGSGHTLLDKILYDIQDIEPLNTERKDFLWLCEQIGNDICLKDKRILIVGAGSLGSYVSFELVKNGAKTIDIFDDDKLEEENILRWAYGGLGKGSNKACTLQALLNLIHPEINIVSHSKKLNATTLIENLSSSDLLIFTIGNSDEQLRFNRLLKEAKCSIPVLFAWLEEGGTFSHILYVNYQQKGCFECLYTNYDGVLVNNRASKNTEEKALKSIIRNGCGGTRAAYGTAILLRTTAALLDIIRDVKNHVISQSTLYDVTPQGIEVSNTTLHMERCCCCGSQR